MTLFDVFWRFLGLGFISFGGPAAHVGYFRKAFVERHQWLSDEQYAGLLSLSQLLPGPGSSQTGFAIGMHRAGVPGGFAAFLGFSLPSFALMYWLATTSLWAQYPELFAAIVHGLKIFAVVVVADATLGMASKFCTTRLTQALAVGTAVVLLVMPSIWGQIAVLLVAGLIAWVVARQRDGEVDLQISEKPDSSEPSAGASSPTGTVAGIGKGRKVGLLLGLFFGLLLLLPLLATQLGWLRWFSDFYTAGSLVFGGGHVVLPLLQQTVGDAVQPDRFLVGYAAAQAVPGPMFSLATFLGAEIGAVQQQALFGAVLATLGVFLPGFLLVIALADRWQAWLSKPAIASAAAGVNAAVVGLLLAALYNPVFVSGIQSSTDMAMAVVLFWLLRGLKVPVVWLVILVILLMALLTYL